MTKIRFKVGKLLEIKSINDFTNKESIDYR